MIPLSPQPQSTCAYRPRAECGSLLMYSTFRLSRGGYHRLVYGSAYLQSPLAPDIVWLRFDPEMPKRPCLFHESDGFRGCFALSQYLPKIA